MSTRQIADLDLAAASGLVVRGDELLVVADDARCLARYAPDGAPLACLALPGDPLPDDPVERKKHKPDYESLVQLPDGSLLALGSGSKKRRRHGAWIDTALAQARIVDLAPLYEELAQALPGKLNLEGAVVRGRELVLGQRGAGGQGSALLFLELGPFLDQLQSELIRHATGLRVEPLELGALAGVPLRLTDLATGPDGALHFSCAAEATDNAYDDAPCAGSRIGRLDDDLRIAWRVDLPAPLKIEGLAFDAARSRWLAVADAGRSEVAGAVAVVRGVRGGLRRGSVGEAASARCGRSPESAGRLRSARSGPCLTAYNPPHVAPPEEAEDGSYPPSRC